MPNVESAAPASPSIVPHKPNKAGFAIKEWCSAVGIAVSTYYALSAEQRPRSVRLHGRVIVIESPADYLARLAAEQSIAA